MVYFLKKTMQSKKGLYLQIYRSLYVPGKGNRNMSYKKLGYACDLVARGIKDPLEYGKTLVSELNSEKEKQTAIQIGDDSTSKNVGYFVLKSILDELEVDKYLDILSSTKKFQFKLSDFVRSMIYAQVVSPGSKHKAFEKVLPNIYGCTQYSYDQILDTINYMGNDYEKFIELFNHQIDLKWPRKTNTVFFDCTNYYFEIDLPHEDKQNGPSKEERHNPIISQGLLLDEEQIPLAMTLFPGNESEKPQLRKTIEDLKTRFDIKTKIIQVADKGLNCARNIYSAAIEGSDGYIFSKSVHGKNLSELEKKWVLLDDNEGNKWTIVRDLNDNICYKYKECIDDFAYEFENDNGKKIKFTVREKRVVTFNPGLARKQRIQIRKQIEKAETVTTIKQSLKNDYGDSIKYVQFEAVDKEGTKIKPKPEMNDDKINEDLAFAGYNLLVTSEIKKTPREIYDAYHRLWRIEESFKVMKTYLDARPVFLQNKESIYGHFLICYLALTVLRLLELKVFNDDIPLNQLVDFIRTYKVTETKEGSYINNGINSSALKKIKQKFFLSKIANMFLSKKDVGNFLQSSFQ